MESATFLVWLWFADIPALKTRNDLYVTIERLLFTQLFTQYGRIQFLSERFKPVVLWCCLSMTCFAFGMPKVPDLNLRCYLVWYLGYLDVQFKAPLAPLPFSIALLIEIPCYLECPGRIKHTLRAD